VIAPGLRKLVSEARVRGGSCRGALTKGTGSGDPSQWGGVGGGGGGGGGGGVGQELSKNIEE